LQALGRDFQARIAGITRLDPTAVAVEFQSREWSWGSIAHVAEAIEQRFEEAGLPPCVPVGWVARNNPSMIAAAIAILESERFIAPLNPHQPAVKLADDIIDLKMPAVLASPGDWAAAVVEAAKRVGAIGIVVDLENGSAEFHPDLREIGPGPHRAPMPGFALERLTSGTTGPPKRIPVKTQDLAEGLMAGAPSKAAVENLQAGKLERFEDSAILFNSFAHSGGLYALVLAIYFGRPIALFERFSVEGWVGAIKRHRPLSAMLVPTMINMILDSDTDPADLASLKAVRSATAPLDPESQQRFEERFNVPVLIDYGASEFIGGVAGWTLREYREFSEAKRGSVGRAKKGVEIRVVGENGVPLDCAEIGTLEVRAERFGGNWVSTTDLASIDEDSFLYIRGRADEAINRGGFKVLPEKVAEVLRSHDSVSDAAILAISDTRLGQAPLAIIELRGDNYSGLAEELDALVREHLPAYCAPVGYEFAPQLPRTVSLKLQRPAIRQMFEEKYKFS
jgi:long-chain acyl-CoA synthetase